MKNQDQVILREIQKNTHMGLEAIDALMPRVRDEHFARELAKESMMYGNYYEKATNELLKEEINYKTNSKPGINVIKNNPCQDSKGNNMICGTISNSTSKPIKNVVIKIELFDKDKNFVAFTEAKIYQLDAKTNFDFQAPIFYSTVASYKIIKVSSSS